MKLTRLRLNNFQCFGPKTTEIDFEAMTFLIGPNAAGKTAVLQALCRLFAFDPNLRRIVKSDFHIPLAFCNGTDLAERTFWIEADFELPEVKKTDDHATIPPHFRHMRLDVADGVPKVRFRLEAKLHIDDQIESSLNYVSVIDAEGNPQVIYPVPYLERGNIHVHYLPARRDPSDHIAYTANSLLGRVLRSVNWQKEKSVVKELTEKIDNHLTTNTAVIAFTDQLSKKWKGLHKGSFFSNPKAIFSHSELEALLRHFSIAFSPAHESSQIDFSRLSDGQKSMLYLSIVLSVHTIGRAALSGEDDSFDTSKLKPAFFTLIAMEEPENSLAPHHLGSIVKGLEELGNTSDAQSLIATHSPSMLKRVDPSSIRYLRLNEMRETQVSKIYIPPKNDEAYKFVKEAVQAFPELYFSRLVILGEGGSEEIVLPRLLKIKGIDLDESSISVVPLGGRHVNHLWRLLHALNIPFVTLLDLDLGRYQGGWGRINYILGQVDNYAPQVYKECIKKLSRPVPKWNDAKHPFSAEGAQYIECLESIGVFFSSPLDLDFAMLISFPNVYSSSSEQVAADGSDINSVLGKNHGNVAQYSDLEQRFFGAYHRCFKLGSKPFAHFDALTKITDQDLLNNMPAPFIRLADAIIKQLKVLTE